MLIYSSSSIFFCIDLVSLMLILSRGIPCFAMYTDLRSGAHEAEIGDCKGLII